MVLRDAALPQRNQRSLTRKKDTSATATVPIINIGSMDYTILLVVILLTLTGIVMVFSASYLEVKDDMFYYFKKQCIYAVIGFCSMIFMSSFNYNLTKRFVVPLYIFCNALLIAVKIIGFEEGGAVRWIKIPVLNIQFQPSEVAKIGIILLISLVISSNKKILHTWSGFIFCSGLVGLSAGLVFLGGLSTALIVGVIGMGIIFVASPHILRFVVLGVSGIGLLVSYLAIFASEDSFRLGRFYSWLNPFEDTSGKGYQVLQSLFAIASGGLFGLGIGASRQKTFIPVVHNDIIFSIICEELGFVGAFIVLLLFGVLIWRGIKIAINAPDDYGALIATGIVIMIAAQVIINVSVVTNTIPNTGVTIPFISSGGTSLIVSMFLMGILLNISRYSKDRV